MTRSELGIIGNVRISERFSRNGNITIKDADGTTVARVPMNDEEKSKARAAWIVETLNALSD